MVKVTMSDAAVACQHTSCKATVETFTWGHVSDMTSYADG